ncbi:PilT protein domain protein [Brachyspira suanatina]|uniref:PilT protein domain protein n=2 Tax=Brachyspira TaxID=29521 RepID=A0A0G4K4W2_9SPIR|nr:PIN domain-containing protein [Brachyspira suanatina]CRF32181.1 PilT protein domain protein [Brachyspira suanatina]
MKRILIDTNIILDYLMNREPFFENSKKIIDLCVNNIIECYIAAHTITNLFYILRKYYSYSERKEIILELSKIFTIIPIDNKKINLVLIDKDCKDIEDGLQIECAKEYGLDYIVTRNTPDFFNSKIKAIEPNIFITIIE